MRRQGVAMMFRKPTIFLILTAFSTFSVFGASLPNLQNALALQPTLQLLAQSSSPGAPSVQLLTPANGATVAQGGTLFLSANVSDPDGVDLLIFSAMALPSAGLPGRPGM